jgi:hypothetical protein
MSVTSIRAEQLLQIARTRPAKIRRAPFNTGVFSFRELSATSRQPVTGVTEQTSQACQAINCGIVCPQSCADRFRAAGNCGVRTRSQERCRV